MDNIVTNTIKLKSLSISNFRLFKELTVDFHDDLTVLIGENGSGKTTIVDGIAKHLDLLINKLRDETKKQFQLIKEPYLIYDESDINIEALEKDELLENDLTIEINNDNTEKSYSIYKEELTVNISFSKKELLLPRILDKDSEEEHQFKLFAESVRNEISKQQFFSLPVLGYYPCYTSNIFSDIKLEPIITPWSHYNEALKGEAFNFSSFANWFTWLYNRGQQKNEPDKTLLVVTKAILTMLNDEEDKFSDLIINYDKYPGEFSLIKKGVMLSFSQLASGEKSLLTLVADLARRLTMANPHKENPLAGQGVVLIDEIDLHLHPKWQRKVIPQLQKTFPNIQFVITTHSPIIVSEIDRENIKILKDDKVLPLNKTPFSKGRDVNSVLNEVFKEPERNKIIKNKIKLLYEYIDNEDTENASVLLEELTAKLGNGDREIVRAEMFFEDII